MITSAKLEVQLIVDGCKRVGITKVVISPGSRNAPLSIAFDEDPHFEVFVVVDERSAAFYALGMAQQLEKPVAIACTSGSAPLNYFPAIAEAYYQGVPLVVITADRPSEWTDQGDGQTIQQENMYGKHVLKSAQLSVIHSETSRWFFERQVAETLQTANGHVKGPVHLNVPFSEPLYETQTESSVYSKWLLQSLPTVSMQITDEPILQKLWDTSTKRLIIVGQGAKNPALQKVLSQLVDDPSVAILVEHTSNVQHPYFIQNIDRAMNMMTKDKLEMYYPDLIISIGGAVISKKIKRFLRESKAKVVKFGAAFPFMDTYQNLVFSSVVSAEKGLEHVLRFKGESISPSTFGNRWKQLDFISETAHETVMPSIPFSDLKVIEAVLDAIPENAVVHVSNSSMIRYVLLFNPVKSVTYRCNRGTSGIDGSSSTAVGAAFMDPENCHVLITGDLSFFYDSNAFWNVRLPSNLRVILVNNGGGDIFNIIPGPRTTNQHERIFLSQHNFVAENIAKAFELPYFQASSLSDMDSCWDQFYGWDEHGRPKLLEVHTSNSFNSKVLDDYFEKCKQK